MIAATDALLILWNDYSGDKSGYNVWHTREHVLQRLTLPGFVSTRRYVRDAGPLPQFMTLYWLAASEALQSDEYSHLLNSPSPWTLSMRNNLTDIMRRGCSRVYHAGHGIGGEVAVKLLQKEQATHATLAEFMGGPAGLAMNSFTLATFNAHIPELPFTAEPAAGEKTATEFLMIESFDGEMLSALLPELDAIIGKADAQADPWTRYRLAFVAGDEDAEAIATTSATWMKKEWDTAQ